MGNLKSNNIFCFQDDMLDSRGQTAVSEEPEDYYGIAGEYGKSLTKSYAHLQ